MNFELFCFIQFSSLTKDTLKSSQWDAWFVFCFLKIIVCKDDEIPAFSAMMKMGLNFLHLTNWLRERNIFGLVWSPCVKICLT